MKRKKTKMHNHKLPCIGYCPWEPPVDFSAERAAKNAALADRKRLSDESRQVRLQHTGGRRSAIGLIATMAMVNGQYIL